VCLGIRHCPEGSPFQWTPSSTTAKRAASPDKSEIVVLRNLTPGRWRVEVTAAFSSDVLAGPTEVTVEAGSTASLAFEIP